MIKALLFILMACGVLVLHFMFSEFFLDEHAKGDRLSNQAIARAGKRLKKKYSMSLSGLGGGADKKGIWKLTILLDRKGPPLIIEEARRILVDCVQEFLAEINDDEALRPYLKFYPFTTDNIYIAIFNFTFEGHDIYDPYLEVMSQSGGEIIYDTQDPNERYKYKSTVRESYEEALVILEREKNKSILVKKR